MSPKRTPAQSATAPPHDSSTASGRIANQSLEGFRALAPSMNMTLTAFLHERGQLHHRCLPSVARDSRASMREPSNAIAAGRPVDGTD